MSTSTLKQRHYAALSSRLRSLQSNMAESERELEYMAAQLQSMARFGVGCGSQFMAVSRLLDLELLRASSAAQGEGDTQSIPHAQSPQSPQSYAQPQPRAQSASQTQQQYQRQQPEEDQLLQADLSYASPPSGR